MVYTQYGHVNEAWRLFERWDDGDESFLEVVPYLSTHPQAADRVDSLEALALREDWPTSGRVTALRW